MEYIVRIVDGVDCCIGVVWVLFVCCNCWSNFEILLVWVVDVEWSVFFVCFSFVVSVFLVCVSLVDFFVCFVLSVVSVFLVCFSLVVDFLVSLFIDDLEFVVIFFIFVLSLWYIVFVVWWVCCLFISCVLVFVFFFIWGIRVDVSGIEICSYYFK